MKKFIGSRYSSIDPAVDVVLKVLQSALAARPDSILLASFLNQYQERGGLSKKQLEGLHSKASKIEGISTANLATLEAIILKKPTRYKSEKPVAGTDKTTLPDLNHLIDSILVKYPGHKRVVYFQSKVKNREVLTTQENEELEKFAKILLK